MLYYTIVTGCYSIISTILSLVSGPGNVWTSTLCFLNVELEWRAHCKLPNAAVSVQQHLYNVVSIMLTWSATWHLVRTRTGLVPVLKPESLLAGSYQPPNESSSPKLAGLTIIMQRLSASREINQMEHEMCLYTLSGSKRLVWQALRLPNRMALRQHLNGVVSKLELR